MPDLAGLRTVRTFRRLRGQRQITTSLNADIEVEPVAPRDAPRRIDHNRFHIPAARHWEHQLGRASIAQIPDPRNPVGIRSHHNHTRALGTRLHGCISRRFKRRNQSDGRLPRLISCL